MNIYGAHQVLNALPAIYAAKALGLSEAEILAGLAHIEKTAMRNDVIAVRSGWILDDSYKSNRQSALAALKTLHDFDVPRRVAVLSDMLDMGEAGPMLHYALGKAVAGYGIDRLCTWGEMSRFTAQGAINAGMRDCHALRNERGAAGGRAKRARCPLHDLDQRVARHAYGQRRDRALSKRQRKC